MGLPKDSKEFHKEEAEEGPLRGRGRSSQGPGGTVGRPLLLGMGVGISVGCPTGGVWT